MQSLKVVIAGPKESGKTAFIRSVSEITVLSTRREIGTTTGMSADRMAVEMDFGRITVADDVVLYLFGTPGQDRVSFMWEMLTEGLLGFVVLVDALAPATFGDAGETIAFLRDRSDVPYVVAANRLKAGDESSFKSLRANLDLPDDVLLLPVDARDGKSARDVLANLADEAARRIK